MYAVIRAGGKQYRVAPGDVIRVEKLATGTDGQVEFPEFLAVSGGEGQIGKPESGSAGRRRSRGRRPQSQDSGLPLQTQEAVQETARTPAVVILRCASLRLPLTARASRLRSWRRNSPRQRRLQPA